MRPGGVGGGYHLPEVVPGEALRRGGIAEGDSGEEPGHRSVGPCGDNTAGIGLRDGAVVGVVGEVLMGAVCVGLAGDEAGGVVVGPCGGVAVGAGGGVGDDIAVGGAESRQGREPVCIVVVEASGLNAGAELRDFVTAIVVGVADGFAEGVGDFDGQVEEP